MHKPQNPVPDPALTYHTVLSRGEPRSVRAILELAAPKDLVGTSDFGEDAAHVRVVLHRGLQMKSRPKS